MERTATTCKQCGRAVWTTDVNSAGICVICLEVPKASISTPPAGVSAKPKPVPTRPDPVGLTPPTPKVK